MAERRMFAKSIIDSDLFLDMPASAQNLYFHLAMRADDDGFVNSPQKIMRTVSCAKNDMDMLVFKNFVIPFESGICVIKHWKIHNYLRNDRYRPTMYTDEKNQLSLDESKAYTFGQPVGIPEVIPAGDVGKDRIGKVRIEEDRDSHPPKSFSLFQNEIGIVSSVISEKLQDDVENYGDEWVCDAIKEAVVYNKRSYGYISTVLKSWGTNGRGSSKVAQNGQAARSMTLEEFQAMEAEKMERSRRERGAT